jgi:hypothetical protein
MLCLFVLTSCRRMCWRPPGSYVRRWCEDGAFLGLSSNICRGICAALQLHRSGPMPTAQRRGVALITLQFLFSASDSSGGVAGPCCTL